MDNISDADLLAALESDPWLHAAATQTSPTASSDPSQTPPSSQALSTSAVLAAQARRRQIIARIDAALSSWEPSLVPFRPSLPAPSAKPEPVPLGQPGAPDPFQAAAIAAALKGQSFFLTGSAGTGKTYVLRLIIRALRAAGKNVAVTASTGCAAVGIQGCTIHSLAELGLGMDPIERLVKKARTTGRIRDRFQTLHALVIDEVSMIDSFLFDKIEAVVRAARMPDIGLWERRGGARPQKRVRNGRALKDGAPWVNAPFGGLQVIVCGDFFQLPPVSASDHNFQHSREKFFAFDSLAWQQGILKSFMLGVVHRQADEKFIGLLNEVRWGVVSERTKRALDGCFISSGRNFEADADGNVVHFTKLFAYRRQVASENDMQLRKLQSRGVRYSAWDYVDRSQLGTLTVRMAEQMLANMNAPVSVEVRQGARVLCLKNLDTERGIVNGAGGEVIGWTMSLDGLWERRRAVKGAAKEDRPGVYEVRDDEIWDLGCEMMQASLRREGIWREGEDSLVLSGRHLDLIAPVVRFDNGITRHMGAERWEIYGTRGQEIGFRKQMPLLLGWALSIHKAQGMTLGEVETDVGKAFDYGQVYVALSRATNIQGLRLRSFDARKVSIHEKVVGFYRELEKGAKEENNMEMVPKVEGKVEAKVEMVGVSVASLR